MAGIIIYISDLKNIHRRDAKDAEKSVLMLKTQDLLSIRSGLSGFVFTAWYHDGGSEPEFSS